MTDAPKRRSLFASDVQLLTSLQEMAPVGEPIPFGNLSMAQKIELLPQGEVSRLIKLQIAQIAYDPDSYAPVNVKLNQTKIDEFSASINAPPKVYTAPKRVKASKPNMLANYEIVVNDPLPKPRTPATDAGYNMQLYTSGMTVADYMKTEYKRDLKTKSGSWFNGPNFQLLYADMAAGNITIYDQDRRVVTKDDLAPRAKKQAAQEQAAPKQTELQQAAE